MNTPKNSDLKPFIIMLSCILTVLSVLPLYFGLSTAAATYSRDFALALMATFTFFILVYTTSWSFKNRKETYKAWLMLLSGQCFYVFAEILYFVVTFYSENLDPIANIIVLGIYPFFIAGFLLFAKKPFKIRTTTLLDLIIFITATFIMMWFLLIEPLLMFKNILSTFLELSYIFLDIMLLFVIMTLFVNRNKKISELTILFLSASVLFQIIGDTIFAYNTIKPNLLFYWLEMIPYMLTESFMILAALSFTKNINLKLKTLNSFYRSLKFENKWLPLFPLILVLFSYSLLFLSENPSRTLIISVGAIVTLVVVRELISVKELKKAQKRLRESKKLVEKSEEELSFVSSNIMDLITVTDENLVYTYVSNYSKKLLGYKEEQVLGNTLSNFIYPEDTELVKQNMEESIENHSDKRIQYRCVRSNADPVWVETIKKPIFNQENEFKGFISSTRDISVQKKDEKIIHDSLREKETLLKEIHHRVKNNLQIVSSLLNLQSHQTNEKEVLDVLADSKNRIKTMALVHEELYRSPNLTNIKFGKYLERLVSNLFYSYGARREIKTKFDMEDINIGIDTAIPCGLIVNELVSNSLKYAFPENMDGKIEVSLRSNNGMYTITVADNGIGLPEDIQPENVKTLGLQLVINLVNQIDGTFEFKRDNGTKFRVMFPELEYKDRIKQE